MTTDPLPETSDSPVLAAAQRIRRLATGQTTIVDLRDAIDPARAASEVLARLHEAGKDVDEFVLDAHQEVTLGFPPGSLKALWGYPVKVIYRFDDDD